MNHIYVPLTREEQWRAVLAKPEHWRHGYSAKLLATAWLSANGFPSVVARLLDGSGIAALTRLELVLALPEFEVDLPGGRRPSCTDLLALASGRERLVTIAVEGKAREPFGQLVGEWKATDKRSGKPTRLQYLCELLQLDPSVVDGLRYQLLHRTASALLAAERFDSAHAVVLVHAFPGADASLPDFERFVGALGGHGRPDRVERVGERNGRTLYLGWATGSAAERWTLHDEIGRILRDDGGPLAAAEIARRINDVGRYRKRENTPLETEDVHERTSEHPELFVRTPKGIALRDPLAVGPRSNKS